jgi:hypothetical protein
VIEMNQSGLSVSEYQWLANTLFSVCGVLLGMIVKTLWDEVKTLRKAMTELHTYINEKHVHKDDFKEFTREVREGLQRIFDRLDTKADKKD